MIELSLSLSLQSLSFSFNRDIFNTRRYFYRNYYRAYSFLVYRIYFFRKTISNYLFINFELNLTFINYYCYYYYSCTRACVSRWKLRTTKLLSIEWYIYRISSRKDYSIIRVLKKKKIEYIVDYLSIVDYVNVFTDYQTYPNLIELPARSICYLINFQIWFSQKRYIIPVSFITRVHVCIYTHGLLYYHIV